MKIKVIQLGNSKGIRLSKKILEKYKINDVANIRLEHDCIVIEPVKKLRTNWNEAFRLMRKLEDDELLIPDAFKEETSWT
ncbi:MAG: AbrB/MazE/SpoVT family DNA-binding domain-containing protein [Saprospiraceae bacterium]|nr:AbrB/MazE/SpoVT family DNA-binding domain-containing protein [Saprospiraceae bacterium]